MFIHSFVLNTDVALKFKFKVLFCLLGQAMHRKGRHCDYGKRNMSVVIFDADIP
jgi:hypothetical protein